MERELSGMSRRNKGRRVWWKEYARVWQGEARIVSREGRGKGKGRRYGRGGKRAGGIKWKMGF